jgi:hypothetical protein
MGVFMALRMIMAAMFVRVIMAAVFVHVGMLMIVVFAVRMAVSATVMIVFIFVRFMGALLGLPFNINKGMEAPYAAPRVFGEFKPPAFNTQF